MWPITYFSSSWLSSFKLFKVVLCLWLQINLFAFLMFHIPLCFFNSLIVLLVMWRHFMLLDIWTSLSWSMIQGQLLSLNIVCCAMFTFQPSSLHISKEVLYDSSNFVSNYLYWIPITSFQRRRRVVNLVVIALLKIVDSQL